MIQTLESHGLVEGEMGRSTGPARDYKTFADIFGDSDERGHRRKTARVTEQG